MNHEDYPSLYQLADKASISGQLWYNKLVKADLVLLVLAAIIALVSTLVPSKYQGISAFLSAMLVFGALLAKLTNRQRRDDRVWFDGRAVAESVKTETWRYMMRNDPYHDDQTCDEEFIRHLSSLLTARPGLRGKIPAQGRGITAKMREGRRLDVAGRRAFYITDRLEQQERWYGEKAEENRTKGEIWFWLSLLVQAAAVVAAIWRVQAPAALNFVGVLAASATAFTAWTQLGRHDELSNSYALANQDLVLLKEIAEQTTTEEQLSQAVYDAEHAISREHIMWIARRGEPLSQRTRMG